MRNHNFDDHLTDTNEYGIYKMLFTSYSCTKSLKFVAGVFEKRILLFDYKQSTVSLVRTIDTFTSMTTVWTYYKKW